MMKNKGLLYLFGFFTCFGIAQEIPRLQEVPEELLMKRIEITPSLTNLAPEIPNTGRFQIRSVNFNTENVRREIDIAAVMAREEQLKTRRLELAPPVNVPRPNTSEVSDNETFSITPRFYNQSFSPDANGRGTRNSVYRNAADQTGATFLQTYSPFVRGYGSRYHRGYYY